MSKRFNPDADYSSTSDYNYNNADKIIDPSDSKEFINSKDWVEGDPYGRTLPMPSDSDSSSNLGQYADMWVDPPQQDYTPLSMTSWKIPMPVDTNIKNDSGSWLSSIASGFNAGLDKADQSIIDIPKNIYNASAWLGDKIGEKLIPGYDPNSDQVSNYLNKASDYYKNEAQSFEKNIGDSTSDKILSTVAGFIPQAAEMATELALPIPKVGSMGKVLDKVGTPVGESVSNLFKEGSRLGEYSGAAAKNSSEFAMLNALDSSIPQSNDNRSIGQQFGDIGKSALEGAAMGSLFGMGGKAVGEAFSHFIPGLGKTKVVGDTGNRVKLQDENGNVTDMNKTIFDNTAQEIPNISQTKPIEPFTDTLDINRPLENTTSEMSSMSEIPTPKSMNVEQQQMELPGLNNQTELSNMKRGQFIDNSIQNSIITPQEVKDNFKDNSDYYIPKSNPEVWDKAQNDVNSSFSKEKNTLISQQSMETAEDTAKALAIYKKYIQDGDMQGATEWASQISGKIRNTAQALQFMSTLKRFTPEWTLNKVQSDIEKTWTKKQQQIMANASAGEKTKVAKENNIPFLSEEASQNLTEMSIKISNMGDGRAKNEAIARMNQYAKEQMPPSILSKINSYHLIAMLSSPKTAVRNIVSNMAYSGVNDVKNIVRTGIDKGIGLFTGERTATLPMLGAKIQGLKEGSKEAWLDFKHDVDTRNSNKFDMNQGSAFTKGPLHQLERAERFMMSDRPFEGMAYSEEFARQKKLSQMNGKEFNEAEAMEKAKKVAAENTFTDNNKLSDLAVKMQRGMNFGKDFGLGSIVLRFAKTPTNIAMRAIDHSPVAFARALKSAVGKDGFNQEAFTDNLAKGTTGVGLMYLGYELSKLGLISTDSEKNTNAQNLQSAAGLGQFKINLSGLNRFINGGNTSLQKGDLHASWDFLQPLSVLMSVGAGLASRDKNVSTATESLASNLLNGFNTLVDQPMTQGLQKLFGTHDFGKAAESFVAALPPSFIPSIVNNLRQITDNQARETYDPSIFKQGLNQAINRIPILEKQLPQKIDIMGQPKETYQNDSNSLLNVLLNPAITTQYLPTPAVENALNLYNQKGEVKALPDLADKKPKIDGTTYQLTPGELNKWQQYIGNKANALYGTPKTGDDIPTLTKQLTQASEQAKVQFLQDRGLPVPKAIQQKADPKPKTKIRTKKRGK